MPVAPSPADPVAADRRTAPRAALRRLKYLTLTVMALCVAAVVAIAAGFVWFVGAVPDDEVVLHENADGIVVLTGGASRIADAIELLAAHRGKRLLISGVHRATTAEQIARLNPEYQALVRCCVDLDHSAVNTTTNAVETRRWAKARDFRSLIVVTSNYHMPRAMAELAQQLPDVRLIAYPVVTEKQRSERWWNSVPVARLLVSEYLKYIVAQVRIRFEPGSAAAETSDRPRFAFR